MSGHCPRCGRLGPYRFVVCDPCWVAEVHPRLRRNGMTQERYLGLVEAALAYRKKVPR